ncbi:hypothetical protein EPO04_00305 [Patescibacteria group bacterium]|nr:MAG: hypothetical protein EPO04_00305 [Patescibacteria group bacterium]
MSPSEQLHIWIPFLSWIFDHGFWGALLGSLLVSHIWTFILVEFGEDRHFSWRLKDNWLGYFGEVFLGVAVACLVSTFDTLDVRVSEWTLVGGQIVILLFAFSVGWQFREGERNRPENRMQDEEAWMASKIHHDLFVMPFFVFMLLGCGIASLAFASWNYEEMLMRGFCFVFLCFWWLCISYDKIRVEKPNPYWRTQANTKQYRRSRWR